MQVLVTGNQGYIGSVLTPILAAAGHQVTGLDSGFFTDCILSPFEPGVADQWYQDVRDITQDQLREFDAIVHLAALSNDPMGDLDAELTYDINYHASVRLAKLASNAGVQRFVFASSCSIYGQAENESLDESSEFNPQTAYARSKVYAEAEIAALGSKQFCPIFMRNATAYGYSPRLRFDLAVNNLTGSGFTTGQVKLLSDGKAWRPLVHVRDIARATLALLEAPVDSVCNQAFNIGRNEENYRIRDVATKVAEVLPNCEVVFGQGAGPDSRTYHVHFGKLKRSLPGLHLSETVESGVIELAREFEKCNLTGEDFLSARFTRLAQLKKLIDGREVDAGLRQVCSVPLQLFCA